jgi:O-antigen biosynthesis protein
LRSVLAYLPESSEVRVLDNASSDNTWATLEALAAEGERLCISRNGENLGYARAMNRCLLESRGSRLVALNPDTVISPGWLEKMAERLHGDVGAVGPLSETVGGDQFVGLWLPNGLHPPVQELAQLVAYANPGRTLPTKMLMGFCVMFSREALNQAGLLEEGAHLGADDLEMSWRLRALGYSLAIAEDVFVSHVGSVSFQSLSEKERTSRVLESDLAVWRKLKGFYASDPVPSSRELWDSDIFQPVMNREGAA